MSKYVSFLAGVSYTLIAVTVLRRLNRKSHAENKLIKQNELIVMHRANAVIIDRVERGHYAGKKASDVTEDHRFENIVQADAIAHHTH